MKNFIIGTDKHTMDNYITHAHLYLARHPLKFVRFENQFPISEFNGAPGVAPDDHFDKLKEELLDVVSKRMARLSLPQNELQVIQFRSFNFNISDFKLQGPSKLNMDDSDIPSILPNQMLIWIMAIFRNCWGC